MAERIATIIAWSLAGLAYSALASAQTCDELEFDFEPAVYGAGSTSITPLLSALATALHDLPEDERFTLFYADGSSQCATYASWREPTDVPTTFKYWDENGVQATCTAPFDRTQFAHLTHATSLCPGEGPVPGGAARFPVLVEAMAFIASAASTEEVISAEAAYHIYGFGAGTYDIEPWNDPEAVFRARPTSWTSVLLSEAIGVPALDWIAEDLPPTAATMTGLVSSVGESGLGYVSSSTAVTGEYNEQTRTLAYQHYGQTCGYLPDSRRGHVDLLNVRTGQYALWTTSSFFASAHDHEPVDEHVRALIGWLDGTLEPPDGLPVLDLIVAAGNVPLCAMQASRTGGEFSALESYAHPKPCHGYFEYLLRGEVGDYEPCDTTDHCDGSQQDDQGDEVGEQCRYGFCEAY